MDCLGFLNNGEWSKSNFQSANLCSQIKLSRCITLVIEGSHADRSCGTFPRRSRATFSIGIRAARAMRRMEKLYLPKALREQLTTTLTHLRTIAWRMKSKAEGEARYWYASPCPRPGGAQGMRWDLSLILLHATARWIMDFSFPWEFPKQPWIPILWTEECGLR